MARTLVASDDFNRANGALGSNWSQRNPNWGSPSIVSNQVAGQGQETENGCSAYVGTGTFTNDHYSSAAIGVGSLGGFGSGRAIGACARMSSDIDGARDMYAFVVYDDFPTPNWGLYKIVNGTQTVIASGAATGTIVTDLVSIEVEGTTLRGYINATLITTQTDSSLSTGAPGFACSNDEFLDNWTGGTVGSGAAATILRQMMQHEG